MKVTTTLLKSDVLNHNGRMYAAETLEQMKKQFDEMKMPLFGQFGYPGDALIHLSNVSHQVNHVFIKRDRLPRKKKKELKKNNSYKQWKSRHTNLMGEIEILDTPEVKKIKGMFAKTPESFAVRPIGIGTVNENKFVENYEFVSFSIINREEDSYRGIIK